MTPAIELTHLRKEYGRRTAVDSLDLRIEPSTIIRLI